MTAPERTGSRIGLRNEYYLHNTDLFYIFYSSTPSTLLVGAVHYTGISTLRSQDTFEHGSRHPVT